MSLDPLELLKLQPDLHMHQICNIEFDHEDMCLLVDHEQNRLKLHSTCINAFGAITQKEYGKETDFLIFSSWLGPLAQAACSQDITSQRYWCFPLCGGRPAHWVFSIFNSQMKTISIFNSIPKLMSSKWAVPMTKDIIGSIRQVVALRDADWDSKPWTENVFNPPPSEEQCDVWSCGLFVMMAMQAFMQERFNFSRCVNARIRDIHAQALRAMFDIPCIIFLITRRTKADFDLKRQRSDLTLSGGEDFDKDIFMQDTCTESSDVAPANYAQSASSEFPDVHMTDRELTSTKSHSPPSGAGSLQIAVPVRCNGCHKQIQLHRQHTYDIQKWDAHKTKCEHITGLVKKRIITSKLPTLLGSTTNQSITSFFKPKGKSAPPGPSVPIVASSNTKTKYVVKTVKAAQSIISHLAEKPVVLTAEPPLQKSCQGLTGDQYNEYILRTHTRSLGGIAPKLRARVAQELFPYKVFPLRRSEKQNKSADMANGDDSDIDALSSDDSDAVELGPAVPKDGNHRVPLKHWSASEHKQMDERLKVFACWEVNYDSREIRSSVCHRLTTNPTQICDACTRVAQDPSFKDAVHRKDLESELPPEKQNEILAKRAKYSSFTICGAEGRKLKTLFKDPLAIEISLVAKSDDALQNPALIFENMACIKRFVYLVGYSGPITIVRDCMKVCPWLAYSTCLGTGYVLGSTLPLEQCEIKESSEIDEVVDTIKSSQAIASQVRAILAKILPIAVVLLPTTGKDDAQGIYGQHMQILKMAAQLRLQIVSFSADGAASELAAQNMMDTEQSGLPPLIYEHAVYGICIAAVVFPHTGPLVSITDPSHAMKTGHNQPQHGTHTGSFGNSYFVNNSLVELYKMGAAGLQVSDVKNVDKQDDGAARRMFHHRALMATTYEENGELQVHEKFRGMFGYLLVFGELFDVWLNHLYSMARSFISAPSFNIFNRLCDTLVALAIIYAKYYPDIPFCPWLLGTEYVEHFFGLARTMLPNFTYSQFISLVKHVMVRHGPLTVNKCTTSVGDQEIQEPVGPATGEESDDETNDLPPEMDPDLVQWDLSETVAMAAADAARDTILNDTLHADEAAVVDDLLEHAPARIELPAAETIIPDFPSLSTFLINGEVSLRKMLDTRQAHQSLTSVKSQCTVMLDPKLLQALTTIEDEINKASETKLSAHEASHRVRLAQDLDPEMRKPKTDRELHWQGTTAKRVMLLLGEGAHQHS
ncbi:hypothetical protein EWM64_g4461 [Hericium alpestre]|uniref:Ubiquitin-like protease family profile domain-containing protein n=1 Tax=Hericium alpestre TaxID=135208 RepID=A0A4Y9ZXN2_9AGAM|nr:hypothetical protein EWM64_g4461 [Hericium alpestre]